MKQCEICKKMFPIDKLFVNAFKRDDKTGKVIKTKPEEIKHRCGDCLLDNPNMTTVQIKR